MATRTYRISLVGEAGHTLRAQQALDKLFEGEALRLLEQQMAAEGLEVQRLASDGNEVVLFVTPTSAPAEAPPQPMMFTALHGGGGSMSSEEPVG